MPASYFGKVFPDVLAEALADNIGVEALVDVNVNISAAVMTALEFPAPIFSEEISF